MYAFHSGQADWHAEQPTQEEWDKEREKSEDRGREERRKNLYENATKMTVFMGSGLRDGVGFALYANENMDVIEIRWVGSGNPKINMMWKIEAKLKKILAKRPDMVLI